MPRPEFRAVCRRLTALARSKIGRKLRRVSMPRILFSRHSVAFFDKPTMTKYVLVSRAAICGGCWRGITLNKLYGQVEKQTAERRNFNREQTFDLSSELALKGPEPTPAEVIAVLEQLNLVSRRLTTDERSAWIALTCKDKRLMRFLGCSSVHLGRCEIDSPDYEKDRTRTCGESDLGSSCYVEVFASGIRISNPDAI